MKLHVLGSGCPPASATRYGSAFLLEIDGRSVMVDCGPATSYKMARLGLQLGAVGAVFLTHHHFDHNVDLPCFVLTRWDMSTGTGDPLRIYGPVSTVAFVDRLLGKQGAFYPDWQSRITHPASHAVHKGRGGELPRPPPSFEVRDLKPGDIVKGQGWRATAGWVHHVEPTLDSLAYRFETDQGSILFAGDCADCPELRDMAKGVDTLVVACAFPRRAKLDPALTDVIAGATEAGKIAGDAAVTRVVLTHVPPGSARPEGKEAAVAEVSRHFDGDILFPDELTSLTI